MALLQLSALFRLRSVLHWDVWSLVVAFIHPWDHWTVGTAHAHSASQTGFAPASAQYASGLSFHCSSIHFTTLKGDHGIDGALGGNFGLQGLGGLGGNGDEEPHEVRVHQLFDPHSVWLRLEQDFISFLGTTLQYSLVVFLLHSYWHVVFPSSVLQLKLNQLIEV